MDETLEELKPLLANMSACMSAMILVIHDVAARTGGHRYVEKLDQLYAHFALAWAQLTVRLGWDELVPSFAVRKEEEEDEDRR